MTEKKLFLLDAMALIYRAYYAMIKSPRISSKGLNTSAILGFTNILVDIIKNEKPTHIAVSFDTGAPTLRHADYEEYKSNRESTPEDIIVSIPYIKQIIEAFNIPILLKDGYEADDIIGTVAKHAELNDFKVYMMTSDKDYGQLVSDNIFIYKPGKFGQKAEVIGVKEVCEKYGLQNPEQLIDILGLWGDASDNIPGVPNVGEVKSKKLIGQFGSIENIYKHIEEVTPEKLKNDLIQNKDQALMSKSLATIILDVPMDYDYDAMLYRGPDEAKLKELFSELEFRNLAQRVFSSAEIIRKEKPADNTSNLFNQPADEAQNLGLEPQKNFNSVPHQFKQINSLEAFNSIQINTKENRIWFDWMMYNGKVIGFAFSGEEPVVFHHFFEPESDDYKSILAQLFGDENRTIVTFECKQTHKVLFSLKIENKANIYDLQIAHYLIRPDASHTLDRLALSYLDYQVLKEKAVGEAFFKEETVNLYGEKVEVYKALYPLIDKELMENKAEKLFYTIEMPLSEVLADMELNGVKVDTSVLAQSSEHMKEELQQIEQQIYDLAGTKFNIASPKQLGEVLFEKLRIIENAKLTKTKQYQTGEEILQRLYTKHPIVPLILEYRSLYKLKSTYIDALPQLINPKTNKIHTNFTQTVTTTGRLSSINPNLQNIPIRTERGREIRKAFVASLPNSYILDADYSQIELRIVAHVCKDESLIEAFRNNADIHTMTASKVYKVKPEEVTPEMRRHAKTVNFGILYGISAFGLADRLQIPQKEARQLITEYYNSFPQITGYLDDTLEFARKNGYVETLFGRRRYIRDINSSNAVVRKAAERNAINAPIQGTAADLIKIAMVNIWKAMKEKHLKSKMILQVHDELAFEVPQDELEIMQQLVKEKMTTAIQLDVPLTIDINYGKNWFEAH